MKPLLLNDKLSIRDVIDVAEGKRKVRISQEASDRILTARKFVEKIVKKGKPVYGINTGFGKFSDVTVSAEDTKQLQLNLIMSHACGVGEPFPIKNVRAMMLLRIFALCRGNSGITIETINVLTEMLNKNVTPYVPSQGSLGASGDLAPLAHMVLSMVGAGRSYYKGRLMEGGEALNKAGIQPAVLSAKEGLALINGTQSMNSLAVPAIYEAFKLINSADTALALTMEALEGIIDAYDKKVHIIRNQTGQADIAEDVSEKISGSKNITRQGELRVQDAYTLRCAPQVHGASLDTLRYVKNIIEREMGAVTDNPLIFSDEEEAISGGNFHGEYLAMAMDIYAIAVSELANISERRIERMVNPQLNNGLPAFLTPSGGLNSGFMIPQYVAAALVSENKVLAHPASVDSITSSANQEDHVSMGMTAARKAVRILENTQRVIAIEIFTACQAIDLRGGASKLGKETKKAYERVRKEIPFLEKDEFLAPYIDKCHEIVKEGFEGGLE